MWSTFKSIATCIFVFLTCFLSVNHTEAQNPHRFDTEISKISKIPVPEKADLSIFTGSSSIRLWHDLKEDCSGTPLVNTAFGGSTMAELLYFLDVTVLRFNPVRVYIYEGDNDLASDISPEDILASAKQITKRILDQNSKTLIYFISAKPSPSRWHLKDKYLTYNSMLKEYCASQKQLSYLDVWMPMLDKSGKPAAQIFEADSLHMNRKGYLIWKEIICDSLD